MKLLSRIMSPQLKGVLMVGFIMIHYKHSLNAKQKYLNLNFRLSEGGKSA